MSDDLQIDDATAVQWVGSDPSGGSFTDGFVDTLESAGEAVLDGAHAAVDVFVPETVEAEVPDLSGIALPPEETGMRSSAVAHEES